MRTIEKTLDLWVSGLLTAEQVTDWAGEEIVRLQEPPMELFDLVTDGPETCLKRAEVDFPPRATRLGYVDEFAVRATAVNFASAEGVWTFADWASRQCMGEDLSDPMVLLGYQLDHLLEDCQDKEAAMALVRDELPALLQRCQEIAQPFR